MQQLTEDNFGVKVCREHELDIVQYDGYVKKVDMIMVCIFTLSLAFIVFALVELHIGNTAAGVTVLTTGVSFMFWMWREPFFLMKWKTRVRQCRQRTARLRDLIEVERLMKGDQEWNKPGKWQWRWKELMNVRLFLETPYDTTIPWTYDQTPMEQEEETATNE
jgi:hypothetical protein